MPAAELNTATVSAKSAISAVLPAAGVGLVLNDGVSVSQIREEIKKRKEEKEPAEPVASSDTKASVTQTVAESATEAEAAVEAESTAETEIIEAVEPYMPEEKPRYLMGVGTPVNILEAVYRGIDLFDCVMPSRNARHGHLFTWAGIRNLNNAKYILDDQPIDEACGCPVCQNYSRAYLHHLFKANEMLGMRLAVMHNIYFYNTLLEKIRFALDQGQFEAFYRQHRESLALRI